MLRWDTVEETTLYDMTVKMYREPFASKNTTIALFQGLELDHYAYKYLQSELYMYRVLDINFESYIEERGDVDRIKKVLIPLDNDESNTVL